jgi:hypothetical protein
MGEYIGFLTTQTLEGQSVTNYGPLADEWRAANDHIAELEREEAVLADNPQLTALPASLAPLGQEVLADPIFQQTYSFVPTDIQLVELDRLVVFQKIINLEYVKQLRAALSEHPTGGLQDGGGKKDTLWPCP